MATAPLDPQIQKSILEAKLADPSLSSRALGRMFNVDNTTVLKYWNALPTPESTTPAPTVSETVTVTGDTQTISLPKTRICTLDELIEHCKIDLTVWEVERFVANKWEVGAKVDDKLVAEPLFQVKAWLRRKKDTVAALDEIAQLKELAKQSARTPEKIMHKPVHGNMLEINIPDVHFGKMAWGHETGGANYDVKIAVSTFWTAFDALISRTSGHQFDEVLFVVGNDLLNSDDIEGRTTAGTSVTTDGRYQKTFSTVRTVMIEAVEKLRQIAKVKVVMVQGNHDKLSVWHLGDSLECYFHNYQDVEIDNTPRTRKYHRFGKVMLMLTHGNKGKRNDYPLLMATEQPEMFGATKFREAHTGHIHQTKLDEQHGVRVRILSALCPADDWHSENGYVGNLRSAEGFIWNKNQGLIGIALYTEVD